MAEKDKEAEEGSRKKGGGLKRLFFWLLVLAVVAYVAAFFLVRTEGARLFSEKWLSDKLGTPVTIGKLEMALPLGAVLRDVKTRDFAGDTPGVEIGELKVLPGADTACRIYARDVKILLRRDNAKNWSPRMFEALGDLPLKNIEEISKLTERFRQKVAFYGVRMSIRWEDGAGEALAQVDDTSFTVEPVVLPSGTWYCHSLKIYRCAFGDYSWRDIVKEWLAIDSRPYVELKSVGKFGDGPGVDFWRVEK